MVCFGGRTFYRRMQKVCYSKALLEIKQVVRTVTEDMMAEGKEACIPIGCSSAALLACQTVSDLSAIFTLENKVFQILHVFPNII